MDLYSLTEDKRRVICKKCIESLEFWLRRIIHNSLTREYGDNYLEAKRKNGDNIINNEIRRRIMNRKNAEPVRYSRLIDASLLEDEIDIICNPDLFNKYFRIPLKLAFPEGREEARTFLKRLEAPRNKLYHANPISVRESEQVICYSNDIIQSLKEYYKMNHLEKEFNVPSIIKATDSFGNVFHFNDDQKRYFLEKSPEFYLRPGDTLTIELEIDPSFPESEYILDWQTTRGKHESGKIIILKITEEDINAKFTLLCRLISKKSWHKFGTHDDVFMCRYKILPLI